MWALFGENVCKNKRIGSHRGWCAPGMPPLDPPMHNISNGSPTCLHITLNNKRPIQYDPTELKEIHHLTQHDNRLKILPFNAIETIRLLGLNNKKRSRRTKY